MTAAAAPYVDIALAVPAQGLFQYALPPGLLGKVNMGDRVWVSVRNRRLVGTVVGLSHTRAFEDLKPVESVIAEAPSLEGPFLEWTRRIAEYYFCSWGQVIDAALPAPFKRGKFKMKSRPGPGAGRPIPAADADRELTAHQRQAYERIHGAVQARRFATFLLHGVTGSGKTEVYLHLIRELLKIGRGSIVLVPEISLTPQTVDRFQARFGDVLAVIHSRLTPARRVEEWHRIRLGKARVVVGARSAVFSPVRELGIIVIDEEQESSYKQEETPRYVTRHIAAMRCELEGAALVLGSATPSLEAYHDSATGKSERLTLPERIEKRPLPQVTLADMRREPRIKTERIFSVLLERKVKESLSKGEQVMLLLNRRGFSTYLHCSSCGYVETCPNCRIALAFHFDKSAVYCHVCHYRGQPERLCPGCRKNYLHYFGIGTQKVEGEASRLFPGARLGRMDSDSTSRKDSHERILDAFKRREIDILIGTQMIAKGHDFPNVSLIGVISADTALHIPDFRSSERTFALLTQVAGRAGRGDIPGHVVVQTYVPHHYAVVCARTHDYGAFYAKEMALRTELNLPPLSHLVRVTMGASDEKTLVRQIVSLARLIEPKLDRATMALTGPAPCLVSKEHGLFKWNFILKGPGAPELTAILREALDSSKGMRASVAVDVDPQ